MEKFCYLGDISTCYCGASEAVSERIGSVWKKFTELSGVLVGKQGLSLKQRGKIYQCCVRPVLLYCCEARELTVADEAQLRGVEHRMIRMCGMRLVDRVSTDVLRDGVGVAVKTEDIIIQSRLQMYGHVMRGDINSQIRGVTEVETTRKRQGSTKEIVGTVRKKDLKYGLRREDAYDRKKWRERIRANC